MQKLSQRDQAHADLKRMIIAGEIAPGDHMDAGRLAESLNIGLTPLREALLRLQTEGIVKIAPKRGVQIVMLSAEDVTDIYQVISAIEIEAVRLLTKSKPDKQQLKPLFDCNNRMIAAAKKDDREEWVLADEAFHRALLELNPNQRLRDAGFSHRDLVQRAHFVALRLLLPQQRADSALQHQKLLDLIMAGDEKKAVTSHQHQRARGADMLVSVLRQYRMTQL